MRLATEWSGQFMRGCSVCVMLCYAAFGFEPRRTELSLNPRESRRVLEQTNAVCCTNKQQTTTPNRWHLGTFRVGRTRRDVKRRAFAWTYSRDGLLLRLMLGLNDCLWLMSSPPRPFGFFCDTVAQTALSGILCGTAAASYLLCD